MIKKRSFRELINSTQIDEEKKDITAGIFIKEGNFEKGLEETINWYLNNRSFIKNISKKNYEKRLGLKL